VAASRRDLALTVTILDQAYDRRSWHGTNLRGSIRRVSPDQAAWRPGSDRHNIWEIVVHAAYWKYVVQRRLTGGLRGSFPHTGSNWFPRPTDAGGATWEADVALLDAMHRSLLDAVSGLSAADLMRRAREGAESNFTLLAGVAAHDLYHAGQIQLLKKLFGHRGRGPGIGGGPARHRRRPA
jgi:uncharacterized damage-inducible protein DinB